jgi:bifunctional UDP-N-acetylglucosamine pyrophosphorylase/glucosamine-1-phosphate N-acetyltransferase
MTHPSTTQTIVILAAGDGTRMRSQTPKVLHELAGRPMLRRILDVTDELAAHQVCVVVAPHTHDHIAAACGSTYTYVDQHERRGTGHAVMQSLSAMHAVDGDVVVLFGDTPLIQATTIQAVIADKHAHQALVGVLSFDVPAPHNYGRIVRDDHGHVLAIVEAKNCTPAQQMIRESNSGIMVISMAWLRQALPRVIPNELTNEYYLTDLVAIAVADTGVGAVRAVVAADASDAYGVNDRIQLAEAERLLQERTNRRLMAQGVTIVQPQSVLIAPEVVIGQDCTIWPGSVITGSTTIGAQSVIGPHTVIENSVIGIQCNLPHCVVKHSTIQDMHMLAPFTVVMNRDSLPTDKEEARSQGIG